MSDLIIEQTDSGESNFILQSLSESLCSIRDEIAGIKALMVSQKETSEQLRQQAEEVLEAHRQAAQNYMGQAQTEPPPDWFPFVSLPENTQVKELTNGNRIFILPDGLILKTTDKHSFIVIDTNGSREIQPGPGKMIEVASGRNYELVDEWIEVTHESAGISGLPHDIESVQIAADRFMAMLPDGTKVVTDLKAHSVMIINIGGEIDYISRNRIEGLAEEIQIRMNQDSTIGFSCFTTGHGGLVEVDDTIRLSLRNGMDLVIHFPLGEVPSDGDDSSSGCDGSCTLLCDRRD